MLLGIFGDTQINDHPPHDQVHKTTQRSTRFDEGIEVTEKVVDKMAEAGAQGILHLGDWTEHKDPTRLENLGIARILNRGFDKGLFWYGLAGNHDGSIFEQTSSSIEHFGLLRRDQMRFYHRPEVDTELGMLAVPYLHGLTAEQVKHQVDLAFERARLTGWKPKGPLFGAFHYGAKGATAGFDNREIQGDYLPHDVILAEPLDHAFGGHIHKAQDFEITAPGKNGVTKAHWWHPGSVVIQNIGERADGKQWILFDTATRKVIRQNIPQPRKFLVIPYSPALAKLPEEAAPQWGPNDIVQLQGEFSPGDHPADTMAQAFKLGVPMPFSLDLKQVKPQKSARAAAALEINTEGGMHEALQSYVRESFKNESGNANIIGPATQTVLDMLEESGLKTYAPIITPVEMELTDILTARKLRLVFKQGVAVIITGENGVGKSNSFEGFLWVQYGETSKGLSLAGVVNRNAMAGNGMVIYEGQGPEGPSRFRITRSVKLNKDLKAAQKLTLDRWDGKAWVSLSDGGVPEVQKLIDQLLGGSFQSVKTTAFSFQETKLKTWDSFLSAHPTERKAILGEVLGLTPLYLAHKELDKRRLATGREFQTAKDNLAGRLAVAEDQEKRVAELQQQLATAEAEVARIEKELPGMDETVRLATLQDSGSKAELAAARTALEGLPNTAAKVSAAKAALQGYKDTQAKAQSDKLAALDTLKAEIVKLQAELAQLQAPTPEAIQAMETTLASTKAELATQQARNLAAQGALQGAQAALTAAKETAKKAKEELGKTSVKLAALPAIVIPDPAALAAAEAEVQAADQKIQELTAASATATAAITSLQEKLELLAARRAEFNGKDIGNCSRCGHAIDSAHIEKELSDIAKDEAAAQNELGQVMSGKGLVSTELGQVLLAKGSATARVEDLKGKQQAAALAKQEMDQLTATFNEQTAALATANQDELTKTQAAAAAESDAAGIAGPLASAKSHADQQQLLVDQAKAQAAAVAEKNGQLQAKKDQETKDRDDYSKFCKDTNERIQDLEQALATAQNEDIQNQALADAMRSQVTLKETTANAAASALTTCMLKQSEMKGALTTATTAKTNATTALADIEAQKLANQEALLQLGMLEQKLQITETACKLVDPKTGLPAHLVDRYLPFLEDRMNFYMEQLGRATLSVAFTPFEDDKDSLAIMINDGKTGRAVEIRGYSGGQLGRVDWSLKFAMADLVRQVRGVTLGLMCCDEPTGGLDDAGITMLVSLLKQRVGTYPVTMIITHDEEMIRSFDQTIHFSESATGETLVAA